MKHHVIATLLLLFLIGLVVYIINSPSILKVVSLVILAYFSVWACIKVYKMIYQMLKNFMT